MYFNRIMLLANSKPKTILPKATSVTAREQVLSRQVRIGLALTRNANAVRHGLHGAKSLQHIK